MANDFNQEEIKVALLWRWRPDAGDTYVIGYKMMQEWTKETMH